MNILLLLSMFVHLSLISLITLTINNIRQKNHRKNNCGHYCHNDRIEEYVHCSLLIAYIYSSHSICFTSNLDVLHNVFIAFSAFPLCYTGE